MRRKPAVSPALPRSTASARLIRGRTTGARPMRPSASRRAGRRARRDLMSSRERMRVGQRFVERHNLWSDEQAAAAEAVEKAIGEQKLDVVRFSFVDQHGALRGKTVMASEAAAMM